MLALLPSYGTPPSRLPLLSSCDGTVRCSCCLLGDDTPPVDGSEDPPLRRLRQIVESAVRCRDANLKIRHYERQGQGHGSEDRPLRKSKATPTPTAAAELDVAGGSFSFRARHGGGDH